MPIPNAHCISSKKHSASVAESSTLRLCWPEVRRLHIEAVLANAAARRSFVKGGGYRTFAAVAKGFAEYV